MLRSTRTRAETRLYGDTRLRHRAREHYALSERLALFRANCGTWLLYSLVQQTCGVHISRRASLLI